jgi:hypothetical protein
VDKSQEGRKGFSSWGPVRTTILFVVVLGVLSGAGWMFLNKGLYLLPGQMCEGVLPRDAVKQVLPRVRSAGTSSTVHGAGENLTFWCRVTTSGESSLSGEARIEQVSSDKWLEYYRGVGDQHRVIRITMGGMQALAQIDSDENTSSVYVPCEPPAVPEYNASRPYAVVGETRVYGTAKAKGIPLRQALTDFAYRLSEHAYKLAECKAPRDFPKELPRYKDSR